MKSIKFRLIAYISLIVLVTAAGLGVLSMASSVKVVTVEAEKTLVQLASESAKSHDFNS